MRTMVSIVGSLVLGAGLAAGSGPSAAAESTQRASVNSSEIQVDGQSFQLVGWRIRQFVVFNSQATNLVGGDSNGRNDLFTRDRQAGTTARISLGADGVQPNSRSDNPAISSTGRCVAFDSDATNMIAGLSNAAVDVYVRDRTAATTTLISRATDGKDGNNTSQAPSMALLQSVAQSA